MKSILLLLTLFAGLSAFAGKFTVNWSFSGVETGYDHDSKLIAFVDGNKIGESGVSRQTAGGSYTFSVPKGKHTVRVECHAFYEGKWELHSKANEYSADAFYESEVSMGKSMTLTLVMDLDAATTDASLSKGGKAPKAKKVKTTDLTVKWEFKNIIEGYDHQNRMQVYVDGKLAGTSKEMKQTAPGTFKIAVPKGSHMIEIVNYTLYEGNWEPHTRENTYSVDAFYTDTFDMTSAKTVLMVFDIEEETTVVKIE